MIWGARNSAAGREGNVRSDVWGVGIRILNLPLGLVSCVVGILVVRHFSFEVWAEYVHEYSIHNL